MRLTKKKARIVASAIEAWMAEKLLSREQGQRLLESCEVAEFDWKRLARYSFWIAIICIMIAVGAAVADDFIRELLAQLFTAPDSVKCLITAGIAAVFYYCGVQRMAGSPEKVYSNEAILFLGVLSTAGSVAFLGRAIDTGSGHFSLLIFFAALIYGVLGLWFRSQLVWVFSLLSLASWMGTETGYMSGWGAYYLGMNYPLRFVLFGLVLTAGSIVFSHWPARRDFTASTRAMGLLNLFIALWILSIFGNYGDIDQWRQVKQIELFHWSLVFAIAAIASIYHGIKEDDGMTRGFGITFLFINLYTRFFEYFWNSTHKAIFFAILALSFWFLGSRAEKIWNFGGVSRKNGTGTFPDNG